MYVVQSKLAEHKLRTSTYEINTMDATAALRAVEQMRVMQVGGRLGRLGPFGRAVGAVVAVTAGGWGGSPHEELLGWSVRVVRKDSLCSLVAWWQPAWHDVVNQRACRLR